MRYMLLLLVLLAGPMGSVAAKELRFRYPVDSSRAAGECVRLVADGYLDAAVLYYDTTIVVRPGERRRLTDVLVNDSLRLVTSGRDWCTREAIERVIDRLITALQAEGYFLARARIDRVTTEGSNVTAHIIAVPGPMVRANRIIVQGLTRSNEALVRRALPALETEPLTNELVDLVEARAKALDYLIFVGPIEVLLRPGYAEADLLVRFRERQQVRFFGGGGYTPDDDAGLVWNVDLALANLFGGGRKVAVRSGRPDMRRTTLSVDYSQPVFWLGIDRLRFSVATRDYRDDFYEFGLSAGYTTQVAPGFELSLNPGWRRVEPSNNEPGYSALAIGLSVRRDRIEQPHNPVGGYVLESDLTYVNRRYSSDSAASIDDRGSYNETRALLRAESFVSLFGSFISRVVVSYQGYETGQQLPPLSELFLIGGPGSIRGYRTEQFAARQAVIATIEPRYRFETGFLFAFFDAAYINRPILSGDEIRTDEFYRSSAGVGLGLVWPSQTVTMSLGWGKDSAVDQPRLSITFLSDL